MLIIRKCLSYSYLGGVGTLMGLVQNTWFGTECELYVHSIAHVFRSEVKDPSVVHGWGWF